MGQIAYSGQKDEELVELVQKGDKRAQEHLFDKYKPLVKTRARTYFLIGADTEDIIQEGMIGLYKAMRDFQKNKNSSFRAFAELCINRQMITAIKMATRQKHIPLNSYISLNTGGEGEEGVYLETGEHLRTLDPEALFISQENVRLLLKQANERLRRMERQVLALYLEGMNYHQIAAQMGKTPKAVDNALQRIRGKIR